MAERDADVWFLRYKNAANKPVKAKAPIARVRQMLQTGELDETVEAAKSADGPFKRLQAYPEFEPLLRSKLARATADKKSAKTASKMADLIANIDEEQATHRRRKLLGSLWLKASSFAVMGLALAGGGYLIWTYVVNPAADKSRMETEKMQQKIREEQERMGRREATPP